MKKKIIFISVSILLIFSILLTSLLISKKEDKKEKTFGVWCWQSGATLENLNFAKSQGVNEIYYSAKDFNKETSTFIKNAKVKGMKTFYLFGDKDYVFNYELATDKIDLYLEFNKTSKYKFSGLHLDVEPHQFDDFNEKRDYYAQKYVDFVYFLRSAYPTLHLDFDIPFWLDNKVTLNGQETEGYKALIDLATRVFVMSYRDSAESIYSISKEELSYAKEKKKSIVLGVETKDLGTEQNYVTFYCEGRARLKNELKKLDKLIDCDYGISVHHLKSLQELKE